MTPKTDAQVRSYQRLLESLNPSQREQMDIFGYFTLKSSCGRTWRIYTGGSYQGNVYNEATGFFYCCHIGLVMSAFRWPAWDHFLAQALILRTDEAMFLSLAYGGGR